MVPRGTKWVSKPGTLLILVLSHPSMTVYKWSRKLIPASPSQTHSQYQSHDVVPTMWCDGWLTTPEPCPSLNLSHDTARQPRESRVKWRSKPLLSRLPASHGHLKRLYPHFRIESRSRALWHAVSTIRPKRQVVSQSGFLHLEYGEDMPSEFFARNRVKAFCSICRACGGI